MQQNQLKNQQPKKQQKKLNNQFKIYKIIEG